MACFAQQLQLVRTAHSDDSFGAQVQKMFLVKHLVGSNAPLQHMVQSYANVLRGAQLRENRNELLH